jgi:hypothetical protein
MGSHPRARDQRNRWRAELGRFWCGIKSKNRTTGRSSAREGRELQVRWLSPERPQQVVYVLVDRCAGRMQQGRDNGSVFAVQIGPIKAVQRENRDEDPEPTHRAILGPVGSPSTQTVPCKPVNPPASIGNHGLRYLVAGCGAAALSMKARHPAAVGDDQAFRRGAVGGLRRLSTFGFRPPLRRHEITSAGKHRVRQVPEQNIHDGSSRSITLGQVRRAVRRTRPPSRPSTSWRSANSSPPGRACSDSASAA